MRILFKQTSWNPLPKYASLRLADSALDRCDIVVFEFWEDSSLNRYMSGIPGELDVHPEMDRAGASISTPYLEESLESHTAEDNYWYY